MLKGYLTKGVVEAGCDEAGRGCLAGPVFAAAVILPPSPQIGGINDSKKLSAISRENLRYEIEKRALAFAVCSVEPAEIDEINILKASFLAMHRALDRLKMMPGQILVDGNRFTPYGEVPYHCIVRGDGKFLSIAAASILAKTYRDAYMREIHRSYPQYGWERNKGYPTRQHREAIKAHGITVHHRRSFRLSDDQLQLDF
jgi:ribonuclease HII